MLKTHHADPIAPVAGIHLVGPAGMHARSISRAVRHMTTNLDQKHTLEELAGIAGCSIWHFDRVFHRVTNLTPMTYLSASRIEAAKRLLVTSDTRIIDICYEVGYNSLGSFGKRFTRMIGMSPRQVRAAPLTFDPVAFRGLFRSAIAMVPAQSGVEINVTGPPEAGDDFLVFAGLFNSDVPSLEPAACSLCEGFRTLTMRTPQPGNYTAYAVAIPFDADSEDMILQDCTLRGTGGGVALRAGTQPPRLTIDLHYPDLLGPPLLPILPLMLQKKMEARS